MVMAVRGVVAVWLLALEVAVTLTPVVCWEVNPIGDTVKPTL
jgi:hypothetical protein